MYEEENESKHEQEVNEEKIQNDTVSIVEEEEQIIPDETTTDEISPKANKHSIKKHLLGIAVASLCGGFGIGAGFACIMPFQDSYRGSSHTTLENNEEQAITVNSGEAVSPYSNDVIPPECDGSIVSIAKRIGPSVVSVYNNRKVSAELRAFYSSAAGEVVTGLGSGIIFSMDENNYYIMTNSHVVEGADSLAVNFVGDIKTEAQLVGKDSVNDIAVVKVAKKKLSAETMASILIAPLGDSSRIEVGQLAIAIGTPATEALNNTVTTGIISAVERNITIAGNTMKLIQTDAAINPGNSGGALVGPTGEVIGMNVAKTVNTEGIGFSIPINTVKTVVVDLMKNGSVVRPGLGILGKDISSISAEIYDLPIGVFIQSVITGGSADLAGIKANDVLIQFDGKMVTSMSDLKGMIAQKRVGDLVEVKLIRDGKQKKVKLELKEMPAS